MTILGNGFPTSVQVSLVGPGGTLHPVSVTVSSGGNTITATFDLSDVTAGAYTLILTSSTGTQLYTRTGAFTVTNGGGPDTWTDVIGPTVIREGAAPTYAIVYGNRGSVDATNFGIWVRLPTPITYSSSDAYSPSGSANIGTDTLLYFELARAVPPNSSGTIPISLNAPNQLQYAHKVVQIQAWTAQ